MKAKDVMTGPVITVGPDADVREIARMLLKSRISAVPVLDSRGRLAGIVSEGDLMRRPESDTEGYGSWWLRFLDAAGERAGNYVKSHGLIAADVMTRDVITITENTSLGEIATLLEKNHIKRVPVLRSGKLVGIVSRANLLHGLASSRSKPVKRATASLVGVRDAISAKLQDLGIRMEMVNVIVSDGVVTFWGWVHSVAERRAAGLVARRTPGVTRVENHLAILTPQMIATLGTE